MITESRLILVRHGSSEWSSLGRYQGHMNVPLSSLGLEQAYALGVELRQYNPKSIVSSDLQRAKHTAEIIAEQLLLKISFDARLRELDCGRWAGLTEKEIEHLEPQVVSQLRAGCDIPRGGGETIADIVERTRAVLVELEKKSFASTLIVVSHAYVIRTIVQLLVESNFSSKLPGLGSYTLLKHDQTINKWILEQYGVISNSSFSSPIVEWMPKL
jgi:probable phosphoglycerate mutase